MAFVPLGHMWPARADGRSIEPAADGRPSSRGHAASSPSMSSTRALARSDGPFTRCAAGSLRACIAAVVVVWPCCHRWWLVSQHAAVVRMPAVAAQRIFASAVIPATRFANVP